MRLEQMMIEFPCPECQQKFFAGLHQLVEGGILVCPECRASNAESELETLEEKLHKIGRSLRNMKRCLEDSQPRMGP